MKNKIIITTWLFYIACIYNSRAQSISLSVTGITNSSYNLIWTATGGITSYNIYNENISNYIAINIPSSASNYVMSAYPCSSYNLSLVGEIGTTTPPPTTTPTRPGDPDPDPSRSVTQVVSNSVSFQTPSLTGPSGSTINLSSSMNVTSNTTNIASSTINILPGASIVVGGSGALLLAISSCGGHYQARSSSDITELPAELTKLTDNFNSNIQIYPNPTNNKITVDIPKVEDNTKITINNYLGQQVYSGSITDTKTVIDLSLYTTGVYMVKIMNNELSKVVKVVKN